MFVLPAALSCVIASGPQNSELTVYNQGFALVKDQRELNLTAGEQEVTVADVAEKIESNSVSIRSLTKPGSISVLEQNYRYDLVSPIAILNKAVGKTIRLHRVLPNGTKETLDGTLISSPTSVVSKGGGSEQMTYNGLVLRASDGCILLSPSGEVEVPVLPEGLISKPSLVWLLDSAAAGRNLVEVSYLTQGMGWTADYVLALDGDGKEGDLKGWVTLTNQSGASYRGAKLKLLAGEVFRVLTPTQRDRELAQLNSLSLSRKSDMKQEEFAEYHLYSTPRPVTVANNELKQVSLMEGKRVPVTKKIILDATSMYSHWLPKEEGAVGTGPIKPMVLIEFKNDEGSNLGTPLPEGRFKVFQRDSSGSLQMLGEAKIGHTPRNEALSLPIGRSFDIVAERKRTNFEWLTKNDPKRGTAETFEIEVRNRREGVSTVHVLERAWSTWEIPKSSEPYTKLDSRTIQFILTLKPNEVKKITYTLNTYWP